jgi:hypothetical protein
MQPNFQLLIFQGRLAIKEYFHAKQQLFENRSNIMLVQDTY